MDKMKLTATHSSPEINAWKLSDNIYTLSFPIYDEICICCTANSFAIECFEVTDDNYTLVNTILLHEKNKSPLTHKVIYSKSWNEILFIFLDDNYTNKPIEERFHVSVEEGPTVQELQDIYYGDGNDRSKI